MICPQIRLKERINRKGYKKNKEEIDKINFKPNRSREDSLYCACNQIVFYNKSVVEVAKINNLSHSTLYSYIRNNLKDKDDKLYTKVLDNLPILKRKIEFEEELGPAFKTIY